MAAKPRPGAAAAPSFRPAYLAVLGAATLAAFWPALGAGFVNWDDGTNIVENFNFRGLGWTQLRWMWTTYHMGHYQPLSWMSLGLDYLLWGMDPLGYHLTNVLLHGLNAVLFYLVARRLMRAGVSAAAGENLDGWALLAALLFCVHPLRVESVAWVTERRDVLSGSFYLAMVLCYLKACEAPTPREAGRCRRAALACFVLSLCSKAIGMTLPAALLVLDVYPLRRSSWPAVLKEKIPFAAAALLFAGVAYLAQKHTGVIAYFSSVGITERLELAAFGAAFYLWKTFAPVHLLPLYARALPFDPAAPAFVMSLAAVVVLCAAAVALRRRWPAVPAAWAYYLITLSPVSGVVLSGIYAAADRYSYLPCLSWALLVAAAARLAYHWLGRLGRALFVGAAGLLIAALMTLTWRQCGVWHDSIELWRYTLSIDARSAVARNNLGTALGRSGREGQAVAEFQSAIALDPRYAEAHNNLGTALVHQDALEAAVDEYRKAIDIDPNYAMARDNLGAVLAAQGKLAEAAAQYRQALAVNPDDAHAHNNLGLALAKQGQTSEAVAEFQRALAISPYYKEAAANLQSVSSGR